MRKKIPTKIRYRTQQEENVLRCARAFARMKAYGSRVEDDHVVLVSCESREQMARHLLAVLESAALEMLDAMSIDEIDGKLVE